MNGQIIILYIGDVSNEKNFYLIGDILKKAVADFEVLFISDYEGYTSARYAYKPDAVLLHYPHPSFNTQEKIMELGFDTPLIMLTGAQHEDFAVHLLAHGAADYILTDNLRRLPYAVINAVEKNRLLIERQYYAGQIAADNKNEVILNSLRSNIVMLNEAGEIVATNRSWKKLTEANGLDVANYGIGSNYLAIAEKALGIGKAKVAEVAAGVEAVVGGNSTFFKTEYLCRFSEKEKWFNLIVTQQADKEKKGAVIVHIDSTDRKLVEKALIQAEANLSAIIENTSDLVYSLNSDLKFVTFNQRFKETVKQVYGLQVKQGDSTLEMLGTFDKAFAEKWREVYLKALNGETVQFVNEYNFGEGKIYLSYSINPIWEAGSVIGLSCFSRDITRQKLDEIALKKSEASLRAIYNNTDMAYLLIDDDFKLVSFNEPAQVFSIEQNHVRLIAGVSIFEYFTTARHDFITDILTRAKNGEIINYQLSLQNNDNIKWFDVTWAGIKNREYENFGYLLTNREITEKKKSEIEREKITADLIKRNKDLEQFTYIISHNLRAPLANIMGLSGLLTDLVPGEIECLEIVTGITTSANKLDEVISDLNQILQVSYLNEKNEQVVLPELVEDIKKSINYLIERENARVTYDFTSAGSVFTLKSYLRSIFFNLILNSIKYRKPDTDPEISIISKPGRGKIHISYSDNGRGIDTIKNKKDLFGLYKRFDTSVEGKGMGLFMVKMQVESLGGKIALHSRLNHGTVFEIEFPLALVNE